MQALLLYVPGFSSHQTEHHLRRLYCRAEIGHPPSHSLQLPAPQLATHRPHGHRRRQTGAISLSFLLSPPSRARAPARARSTRGVTTAAAAAAVAFSVISKARRAASSCLCWRRRGHLLGTRRSVVQEAVVVVVFAAVPRLRSSPRRVLPLIAFPACEDTPAAAAVAFLPAAASRRRCNGRVRRPRRR